MGDADTNGWSAEPTNRGLAAVRRWVTSLALIGGFVLVWEVWVSVAGVPRTILAPPSAVLARLTGQPTVFVDNAFPTVSAVLIGLVIGIALGVGAAFLMAAWRPAERALLPIFVVSQVVPTFALAPILVLWLGFGLEPRIIIIVIGVFFPVAINTTKGLRSADPGMIDLLRSYRAATPQVFRIVRIPASLPFFFASAQLAVAYSVLGTVFVEWFGSQQGLGKLMLVGLIRRQTDLMMAAMIAVAAVALVLWGAVRILAHWAMPWTRLADPFLTERGTKVAGAGRGPASTAGQAI